MPNTLSYIYHQIERPLLPILAEMQARGVLLDREGLAALSTSWEEEASALASGPLAGVNPRSNQQVVQWLQLMGYKWGDKTPGGAPSVAEDVLQKLYRQHPNDPFLSALLHFREVEKLRSTYGLPLLKAAELDGRVHTQFHQDGTETGRFSSSKPNLQNIPAVVRPYFIASDGLVWVKADYSQMEMRVVAVLAGEESLLQAYRDDPTMDAHAEVTRLLGLTPDQRRVGKTLNFALVYGMSIPGLAQELNVSVQEAQELREQYWTRLPKVAQWMRGVQTLAQVFGYVETLFGRRHYLPFSKMQTKWQLEALLREAVNMPVQGTAADILKRWMGCEELHHLLQETGAYMLLTVHDELDFEVPINKVAAFVIGLKKSGEKVVDIGVPLVLEIKQGRGWI